MRDLRYTRQERTLILWLRFLTFAFLLVGVLFLLKPNYIPIYLNSVGATFFGKGFPLIPNPSYDLWWILSVSVYIPLIYASFFAQWDWLRYHDFVPIIILTKAGSTLGLVLITIFKSPEFFYIVASITDGLVFLITWYAYKRAIYSRSFLSKNG